MLPRNAGSWYARDHGFAAGKRTGRSIVNIRELDEESRRTGVWPPRRIILRVEREEARPRTPRPGRAASRSARWTSPRRAPRAPRRRSPRPPAAGALAVAVGDALAPPGTARLRAASRRPPPCRREDAEFEQWVAAAAAGRRTPSPSTRRRPRGCPTTCACAPSAAIGASPARPARSSSAPARRRRSPSAAAPPLLAVVGLSQTESVGGSLGVPSIGLFGPRPSRRQTGRDDRRPTPASRASAAAGPRGRGAARSTAARRARLVAAGVRARPRRRLLRERRAPSASSPPARRTRHRRSAAQRARQPAAATRAGRQPRRRRRARRRPAQATLRAAGAAVVWDAPSQPAATARPAPSRPATPAVTPRLRPRARLPRAAISAARRALTARCCDRARLADRIPRPMRHHCPHTCHRAHGPARARWASPRPHRRSRPSATTSPSHPERGAGLRRGDRVHHRALSLVAANQAAGGLAPAAPGVVVRWRVRSGRGRRPRRSRCACVRGNAGDRPLGASDAALRARPRPSSSARASPLPPAIDWAST